LIKLYTKFVISIFIRYEDMSGVQNVDKNLCYTISVDL